MTHSFKLIIDDIERFEPFLEPSQPEPNMKSKMDESFEFIMVPTRLEPKMQINRGQK